MAVTITGSQVQFSSYGPLEGVYQGTSSSNTVFPVGSLVMGALNSCCSSALNLQVYPGVSGGVLILYNPRTLLSGTWRQHGVSGYSVTLCQRVS